MKPPKKELSDLVQYCPICADFDVLVLQGSVIQIEPVPHKNIYF